MKKFTRLSLALILFSLFSISYLVASVSANPGHETGDRMNEHGVIIEPTDRSVKGEWKHGNTTKMGTGYKGNGEESGEGRGIQKTDDGGWQERKDAECRTRIGNTSIDISSYSEEDFSKWCEDNPR
jgi:hypothetical protein